jgi:AraC family transcriptional regulator
MSSSPTPEPSANPAPVTYGVEPRWYLWDGGFFAVGKSEGVVPTHAHHAIQIVLSLDRPLSISAGEDAWQEGRGIIVLPDVVHRYNGNGASAAMLFVDPESAEGVWLRKSVGGDIAVVPDARVDAACGGLAKLAADPFAAVGIRTIVRDCVQSLSAGVPPARHLDPRVTAVLRHIRESDDLRISLETAAASAFLSPSRFQHLFKQQVGLAFRRYMLWRKLTRAMLSIGRERTLSAAAQASDFSDAAHLTRTFYQMFGIPPSVMMRGEFFVIDSPFA